ncbi:hypothetical protein EAH79_07375 [Sphingomonas koreensis]|nr:hypothetical protein EAH79_07375 [Sphingomonas koreensis]
MKLHARARARGQREVRVGKLVPLMALYVLVGQLTGWTILYNARDGVPFNYVSLVVVTIVVGGYYLLSSLVWPEEPGEWPDFDAYYDQFNRLILTGNLMLTLVGVVVSNMFAPPVQQRVLDDPTLTGVALIGSFGGLLINIVLIFVRGRRLNAALLALLIVLQLGGSVALMAAGLGNSSDLASDQLNDAGRSASRSSGVTAAVASGRKS